MPLKSLNSWAESHFWSIWYSHFHLNRVTKGNLGIYPASNETINLILIATFEFYETSLLTIVEGWNFYLNSIRQG